MSNINDKNLINKQNNKTKQTKPKAKQKTSLNTKIKK